MPPQTELESASEEVTQKFRDILKKNGISDEVKSVVITEPPELKGEHMATATVYAKVEFKDGKLPVKNLFVKKFTSNEHHTKMVKEMRIMEKESIFYNEFLPALKDFCKKFEGCDNLLSFFPKMLHGDDEMIVLENLVLNEAYIMLPKEDKQDLYTAKYVLQNLAKFHASTFAFIEEMGQDEFQSKWKLVCHEAFFRDEDDSNPMMASMFDNGMNTCLNILKGYPVEGDKETSETITGYLGKSYPLVRACLRNNPERKSICLVNHGDFHNNNMLFKKDPSTGQVNDIFFVDLQITRYGSPNLDIGYFLYTSVKPHVRRAHLKELIQHYYDTFVKTLTALNGKMDLTFDEFFEDYKEKSQLGFYFNLSWLAALGAMKDMDMENVEDSSPEAMMAMFNKAIENWIKNNPDKAAEISTEIVAVIRENKELHP